VTIIISVEPFGLTDVIHSHQKADLATQDYFMIFDNVCAFDRKRLNVLMRGFQIIIEVSVYIRSA